MNIRNAILLIVVMTVCCGSAVYQTEQWFNLLSLVAGFVLRHFAEPLQRNIVSRSSKPKNNTTT